MIKQEWLRIVEAELKDFPRSRYNLERGGKLEILDVNLNKVTVDFAEQPTVAKDRVARVRQIATDYARSKMAAAS
ncbi:MAG: hypothetical protein ABL901_14495 [Hyphomicrobiaceae bacterium]